MRRNASSRRGSLIPSLVRARIGGLHTRIHSCGRVFSHLRRAFPTGPPVDAGVGRIDRLVPKLESRTFLAMRVIVTGGAGFIGSNFVNSSVEKYPDRRFINADALT